MKVEYFKDGVLVSKKEVVDMSLEEMKEEMRRRRQPSGHPCCGDLEEKIESNTSQKG